MSAPRILIVEDEVIVAMELKSRLTAFGYEVVGTLGRGEEAIEIAATVLPDLVLMDIKLAGKIDGIEAARKIHEFHDIPVVYLTAHSDEQTLQKAKLGDPFAYLVKPFAESELRTTIEVALHKHRKEQQMRETAEWFSQTVNGLGGAVIGTGRKRDCQAHESFGRNALAVLGNRCGRQDCPRDPAPQTDRDRRTYTRSLPDRSCCRAGIPIIRLHFGFAQWQRNSCGNDHPRVR